LKDFREIVSACKEKNIEKVLLTQKDAVKFDFISPVDLKYAPEFLVLKIKVVILEKKDEFFARIDNLYSS
jgi:tetraacyldisaccharide-1-P 4'-kinase